MRLEATCKLLLCRRRVATVKLANSDITAYIHRLSTRRCSSHANPQSDSVVNMRRRRALQRRRRVSSLAPGVPTLDPQTLTRIACRQYRLPVCRHLYLDGRAAGDCTVAISRRNKANRLIERLVRSWIACCQRQITGESWCSIYGDAVAARGLTEPSIIIVQCTTETDRAPGRRDDVVAAQNDDLMHISHQLVQCAIYLIVNRLRRFICADVVSQQTHHIRRTTTDVYNIIEYINPWEQRWWLCSSTAGRQQHHIATISYVCTSCKQASKICTPCLKPKRHCTRRSLNMYIYTDVDCFQ